MFLLFRCAVSLPGFGSSLWGWYNIASRVWCLLGFGCLWCVGWEGYLVLGASDLVLILLLGWLLWVIRHGVGS